MNPAFIDESKRTLRECQKQREQAPAESATTNKPRSPAPKSQEKKPAPEGSRKTSGEAKAPPEKAKEVSKKEKEEERELDQCSLNPTDERCVQLLANEQDRLKSLALRMSIAVDVADRKHCGHLYEKCFVGEEAVRPRHAKEDRWLIKAACLS
eukprot:1180158-Prorocentrum_minimum.AAC.1